MNPADEAAVKQAEYNANMARRDAGNLGTEAIANAAQFTTMAEQKLAQGITILGKTGNLSVGTNAAMESGVALGTKDTAEFTAMQTDLQGQADALSKQIAEAQAKLTTASKIPTAGTEGGSGEAPGSRTTTVLGGSAGGVNTSPALPSGADTGRSGGTAAGPSEYDSLQAMIKKAQGDLSGVTDKLTAMGPGGAALQDIRNPDALLHASGSDLLTMVSTRDQMERDKRTLFRSGENTQVAMLKAAGQYDVAAQYAKEAASWNTWTTLLGGGIKLAELGKMFL